MSLLYAKLPGLESVTSRAGSTGLRMKFVWERNKALFNERKHGISFELAKTVFFDQFIVTREDDRFDYGEERFLSVGEALDGRILAVAHTDDFDTIRIISARKATRTERRPYEKTRFKT